MNEYISNISGSIGCYQDNSKRDLPKIAYANDRSLTNDKCIKRCRILVIIFVIFCGNYIMFSFV